MKEPQPQTTQFESIFFVTPGSDELDAYVAPVFRNSLEAAIRNPDSKTIIADLSETEFLDSLGLGVLIGGLKKCRQLRKSFYVDITGDERGRLQKIFEITGTEDLLYTIRADEGIK